jgi:hypothetical protein
MAFLGALPQQVSLAILARLNPLSIKKLCAASTEARAAASQCITSLEWDQPWGQRPPLADLSAAFPAATSLKLTVQWARDEDAVAWLRANHQLLTGLQALDLRFWSQLGVATTRSLDDAVVLHASQCTALRSLALIAGSSSLHALAALTNLTSLDLRAMAASYRDVVQTLRKLPGLQRLRCCATIRIDGDDLALTSQLAALTSLEILNGVERCGALAAASGLRALGLLHFDWQDDEDYWEGSEGPSRLTQLRSLHVITADLGEDAPHLLSALTGLSSLDVESTDIREGSITALAGLLRGLGFLGCRDLGSEGMDPSLLHSIGCTSLRVAALYANCQLVSAEAPPLPHLQSLQLWAGPCTCPLVLHLAGLTSLSIEEGWGPGISDNDCRQLADRLPLLHVLQLLDRYHSRPPAHFQLTLDGLRHLSRLRQLQQLCLVHPHLPPPSYAVLAQCSALRRLLLDCGTKNSSKLSGAALEACLIDLAAWRQLRHVVLLRQEPTSECEAVQEVCDRVVGAARRHELVMEVKRWGCDQAWAYMLEQAV